MLRNYLTIALRTLRRHPGYTAINVMGLAVGMVACLLIGLYVEDELSYDTFHKAADQIMVVGLESDFFGQTRNTPYVLASTLTEQLPEVAAVTRIDGNDRIVRDGAASFEREQRVLKADSTFFDVFSFPLQRGNPATVLDAPHQAVITASMAEAFFGAADPMGRTLTVEGIDEPVTVAGVARDMPSNSTIQFDLIVPMHLAPPSENQRTSWGTLMFHTYARLGQPVEAAQFGDKVAQAVAEQIADFSFSFTALPLPDLYLSGFYEAEGFNGQRRYVYLFGTMVLLILGIAAINYVNLVTAQADRRAREVGVRKTMGARRGQVARQFLGETALLSTVALVVALLLMSIALPAFNGLFDKELTLWTTRHASALVGLAAFVLIVSIAAGTYPAFVLAGYHPVRVLRGAAGSTTRSGGWLRKGLVVTQFAVSAGLILGTIVMYQQLNYVQTKNLGFDGEQENVSLRPAQVDANYVETLGLELIAGRSFSVDRATDRMQAYVLNEAAATDLGWTVEGAVGKPFQFARGEDAPMGEVIGVVENFHIESLRDEMSPVVLQMESERFSSSGGILAAKLAPEGIQAGMSHVKQVMAQAVPEMSFEYTFLDEGFDAMYRSEERLATIFTVFAGIAILVACMGLFGLAAYAAQRRTKEIGIRKALGASLTNVVALLSKEFALLVGIALVVGAPAAYWGMQQWLQDFAYRIEVGPFTFIVTVVVALVVAGGSVSVHALRAARTDPATALRTE